MLPSLSLPGSGSINMVPEEKHGDYLTHESQQHSLLSLGTMVPLVVAVPTVLSDGESCLFGLLKLSAHVCLLERAKLSGSACSFHSYVQGW